eukprot:CAMPEP_0170549730 /NCGR_PEP_ID=MMETSP0211-20121228/7882_1 /TAXON_ID=311385 /ORGANISM="Pseudokeronopsis sp., Strain OXSARD2" /LENGTH=173 /DNA_ID=CAMNT_0010855921 /DNA_START=58 /DNA_END=579 /DNA_ORIENTATION=-
MLIDNIDFNEQNLMKKILELLCMLSKKNEKYLKSVIEKMVSRFQSNREVITQEKMNTIIQILCTSMYAEKVFLEFAKILENESDLAFVSDLIETLTLAAAASPLYLKFRNKLLGKQPTEHVNSKDELFMTLFSTWSYNPISTLTLCLLSRNYELAYNLIPRFTMIELDTSKLI